jgi:uncharacterized membrane protein YoaK (UPF0700 family)
MRNASCFDYHGRMGPHNSTYGDNIDMAPAGFVERHWPRMAVALVLTFVSGLVDIIGYRGVFHFFTAHLTGTTVQIGRSLVARSRVDLFAAAYIVGAFLAGSLLGRVLIEIGSRNGIRRIACITLAIEAVMLAGVTRLSPSLAFARYADLALLAGAMGIQTATLTGIGPLTVHTTFVTGMVNKLAQLVSHILFRSYDLRRSGTLSSAIGRDQRRDIEMASFLATIWCFYVGGAAFGTWSFDLWKIRALFVAVALLVFSLVAARFWPLSIQEEQEQSER